MIVLIPRMEIQSANALVGQHFVATTPIMAASLMGHALGRALGQFPTGVAWLHHTAQLLGAGDDAYGRFQPQQRRGAVFIDDSDYSSKNKHALSLQPTASAHITASVLFRFERPVPEAPVLDFLRLARVAGGVVREHGPVHLLGADADATEEQHCLSALPGGGYWLIERSDLVDPDQPLDSLMTALAHRPVAAPNLARGIAPELAAQAAPDGGPKAAPDEAPADDGWDDDGDGDEDRFSLIPDGFGAGADAPADPPGGVAFEATRLSWLAPAVLGYALTTEAVPRGGVRGDHAHAYAEPLIGLTQFVSQRQHTGSVPWWRHGWSAPDVFLVTQDPSQFEEPPVAPPATAFSSNPGTV